MLLEDLDPFLIEFGLTATVLFSGGTRSLRVLFDEENEAVNFGTASIRINDAEGRSLIACAKSSDCVDFHHGNTINITFEDTTSRTFKIVGIEPIMDGKFTELVLKIA
jgi:hypothetical protein